MVKTGESSAVSRKRKIRSALTNRQLWGSFIVILQIFSKELRMLTDEQTAMLVQGIVGFIGLIMILADYRRKKNDRKLSTPTNREQTKDK